MRKDSNVAVGGGSIVNVFVVGDVADELHDQGCGDSAAEAMPSGVVGFILGVYLSLSIAAMPPVSLVGLSWAMDPSDRSSGDRACKGTCPVPGAATLARPRRLRPVANA